MRPGLRQGSWAMIPGTINRHDQWFSAGSSALQWKELDSIPGGGWRWACSLTPVATVPLASNKYLGICQTLRVERASWEREQKNSMSVSHTNWLTNPE